MMRNRFILTGLIALLFTAACARSENGKTSLIVIEDPWVRPVQLIASPSEDKMHQDVNTNESSSMPGMESANSAAYMLLQNSSPDDDRLIAAQSDVAQAVEIHLSEMKDGVMSMRPVDGVDIPAGGQAELKPGGFHIMLIGIKKDLVPGDTVSLQLTFEKGGTVDVTAEVRNP
jgi:periplasmic copper chaperone A